ncbi:hypothetical protein APV28_2548 [Comamonas testosteroni]|nr:hypothetical protein APV28_2548 [Comamonas testosteroni]
MRDGLATAVAQGMQACLQPKPCAWEGEKVLWVSSGDTV